jgi:hypothetical protein
MLTRRRFVKVLGGAAAIATLPIGATGCGDNDHLARGRFLDQRQWRTIDLATGIILPSAPDQIGAREANAVGYIDGLLAAFDVTPPAIFAAGPFSGRAAIPDSHGAPTKQFPADDFARFLPLSRVQDIAWRVRLFGSAQTAGGGFNDAVLGATTGWRALYRDGIARLDRAAATIHAHYTFDLLEPADQSLALDTVAADVPAFWQALVEHTLEGTFAAPEYGGNRYTLGWRFTEYDGDSAPLGHAFFDESTGAYVDRADQPTSQPSPDALTEAFDDEVIQVLTIAALGSGGKRFF